MVSEKGLHPVAAEADRLLRAAAPGLNGIACDHDRFGSIRIAPASIHRAVQILDQLGRRAGEAGYPLVHELRQWGFKAGKGVIAFELVEYVTRVPHVITAEEIAAQRRWDEAAASDSHDLQTTLLRMSSRPQPRRVWDPVPTGGLMLKFINVGPRDGPRVRYVDSSHGRLEDYIPEIVASLPALAAQLEKAMAEVREEQAARARAEEELKQRAADEQTRRLVSVLLDMELEKMARAERIEAYLAQRAQGDPASWPPQFEAFIDWAKEEVARLRACPSEEEFDRQIADATRRLRYPGSS